MDGITLEKEVGRKIRYYRKKKKLNLPPQSIKAVHPSLNTRMGRLQ